MTYNHNFDKTKTCSLLNNLTVVMYKYKKIHHWVFTYIWACVRRWFYVHCHMRQLILMFSCLYPSNYWTDVLEIVHTNLKLCPIDFIVINFQIGLNICPFKTVYLLILPRFRPLPKNFLTKSHNIWRKRS